MFHFKRMAFAIAFVTCTTACHSFKSAMDTSTTTENKTQQTNHDELADSLIEKVSNSPEGKLATAMFLRTANSQPPSFNAIDGLDFESFKTEIGKTTVLKVRVLFAGQGTKMLFAGIAGEKLHGERNRTTQKPASILEVLSQCLNADCDAVLITLNISSQVTDPINMRAAPTLIALDLKSTTALIATAGVGSNSINWLKLNSISNAFRFRLTQDPAAYDLALQRIWSKGIDIYCVFPQTDECVNYVIYLSYEPELSRLTGRTIDRIQVRSDVPHSIQVVDLESVYVPWMIVSSGTSIDQMAKAIEKMPIKGGTEDLRRLQKVIRYNWLEEEILRNFDNRVVLVPFVKNLDLIIVGATKLAGIASANNAELEVELERAGALHAQLELKIDKVFNNYLSPDNSKKIVIHIDANKSVKEIQSYITKSLKETMQP